MDIFESLENIKKSESKAEHDKYIEAAKEYRLQGFVEDQIAELLQIDGCDTEISKELAKLASGDLPDNYDYNVHPEKYSDLKNHIENTVKFASVDKITHYFDKLADRRYAKLFSFILKLVFFQNSSFG